MNGWQKKQVIKLLDRQADLSQWEWEFVNSLADREEKPLSEKQNSILNRLAEKVA